ncbi:unnamed protein product [Oncorhynchus mykiss]|uniref:YchF C-terminal domain-containing protein n=1 Tax=Oncorhynchus mykiss TaxID=8022 RepID=A0A060VXV9_ONCMY|nr:unnamed protein product [Oncorhynchus mykiss]
MCVVVCSSDVILFLYSKGAFADEDIVHVEGNVDPVRDIEIIHEELRLKDEEMIGPIMEKLEKVAVRGSNKKLKPEYKGTKAPQAAGKIHADFEKGFVMAEVMKFSDFKEGGKRERCQGEPSGCR